MTEEDRDSINHEEDVSDVMNDILRIIVRHPSGYAIEEALEWFLKNCKWDYDKRNNST